MLCIYKSQQPDKMPVKLWANVLHKTSVQSSRSKNYQLGNSMRSMLPSISPFLLPAHPSLLLSMSTSCSGLAGHSIPVPFSIHSPVNLLHRLWGSMQTNARGLWTQISKWMLLNAEKTMLMVHFSDFLAKSWNWIIFWISLTTIAKIEQKLTKNKI